MVFVDEDQISALERDMQASGVLEGSKMAMAFNMLRSNDLIWSYVVRNYLKGQPPSAFDLLHWNSDATRMPAANHSYYLRNCYLENRLSTGSMVLDNTLLDLSKVKLPIYNLATREDHIAPAESVLYGSQFFGGPVKYVLSGSGHIAGVVNPPASGKYQFWTNDNIKDVTLADWLKGAQEHKGSWWPNWREWLGTLDAEEVPARGVGTDAMPADRGCAGQLRPGKSINSGVSSINDPLLANLSARWLREFSDQVTQFVSDALQHAAIFTGCGLRNSRTSGYQGLSSRSSSQR